MYKYLFPAGLLLCSLAACKEDKPAAQQNDGVAPGSVTNAQVERLPGAIKITYALPHDVDVFYVEGDCETSNRNIQAKASFYKNHLTLEGFGDTSEYEVKLYAVDRGENRSEPLVLKAKPGLPPVQAVHNSIIVNKDFGGIHVTFKNKTEADLVIKVLTPDSAGEWREAETYYTSRPEGAFSVRGYEAVKRKFALFVRDQWANRSDTLVTEVVPLFEKELDKSKFREYRLPTDATAGFGWVMPRLWDGSIVSPNGFHTANLGTTANPSGFPHHYTFDLGVVAKLSRYKFWQRDASSGGSFLYAHGNLRKWEIWGAVNPAADGSWNGWTKLMDCESIKPSGLPIGQVSNEDKAYAAAGEEYIFPSDIPPVRYIRVKVLSNWGGNDYSHVMEMTFWGAEQ